MNPPRRVGGPDIFTYLDYRVFLRDAFAAMQAAAPRLSYRAFAKKAGFASPNFLQRVIEGKRNLSATYQVVTAKAFRLNRLETEFFQHLVGYAQAKSHDEKDLAYQRILRNHRFANAKSLGRSQYDFFSKWYVPVVRELLTHPQFTGEDAWIAELVFPRITAPQVAGARALLERIGLVERNPGDGKWKLSAPTVSTESEAADLGIANYHMAAIQLARDAVKAFPRNARDIRSVTLGLPEAAYAELKARLEDIWKEILAFAGQYENAETVYQFNLQLFPLVRENKKPHA